MYPSEDDSHSPNNNYTNTATATANNLNHNHNNGVYNQNGLTWEWAQQHSSMVAEEDRTPNLLLMHENGLVNLPQPHTTNPSCTPNSFLNSDHTSLNPNWGNLQAFEQARLARSTPFGSATLFNAVSGLSNNNITNQSYLVGYGGQPNLGLMANHMISVPNSTAVMETEESRVFADYMKRGLNAGDFNSRLGLNLGGRMYFDDILAPLLSFGKRPRPNSVTLTQPPLCQVEGCKGDLTLAKHYHRRHKVCDFHSKSPTVVVSGTTQRFCQQCSRFHSLSEFDEGKRSCRKRLADHNRRRRKPQPNSSSNPSSVNSTDTLTKEEVKRIKPAGLPALTQSETHASSSNIVAVADSDMALDSKEQLSLSLDKKIKEKKMVPCSTSKPSNLSLSTSLPSPPLGQPLDGLHLDASVDPWQIQATPNCNGLLLFTPDHIAQQRANPTLHNATNITTTTTTSITTATVNNNNMAFSALPNADSPRDNRLTKNYCSSTSDWSTIKGFDGNFNDEFDSPQLSLQGSSEMRHHVLSLLEERQVEQKAPTIISLDQHHNSHSHHLLLPPQQHLAEQVSGHDNDNQLFFPTNTTNSVNNQPDHFKLLGLQAWRPFNKLIYNAAADDRI